MSAYVTAGPARTPGPVLSATSAPAVLPSPEDVTRPLAEPCVRDKSAHGGQQAHARTYSRPPCAAPGRASAEHVARAFDWEFAGEAQGADGKSALRTCGPTEEGRPALGVRGAGRAREEQTAVKRRRRVQRESGGIGATGVRDGGTGRLKLKLKL
ncbi:hypothetical protein FA95DRAFT_1574320 [Auriscalpium vulgare]|uniref:Uncharacterized protein n=1 Tax=Auriscalpium vulgare TaxID=40419 RepID=A0ACB8RLL1_9AGAM|nr:hypothetical protein FA95DRAFT_1574320 [Auriscalpium vulgare]